MWKYRKYDFLENEWRYLGARWFCANGGNEILIHNLEWSILRSIQSKVDLRSSSDYSISNYPKSFLRLFGHPTPLLILNASCKNWFESMFKQDFEPRFYAIFFSYLTIRVKNCKITLVSTSETTRSIYSRMPI